jgi:hypothetical protein
MAIDDAKCFRFFAAFLVNVQVDEMIAEIRQRGTGCSLLLLSSGIVLSLAALAVVAITKI